MRMKVLQHMASFSYPTLKTAWPRLRNAIAQNHVVLLEVWSERMDHHGMKSAICAHAWYVHSEIICYALND